MSTTKILTQEEVQNWLTVYLSKILQVSSSDIDIDTNFKNFGLDSVTAVALSGDLGEWVGKELDPTITFDFPTIKLLSKHLVGN